MEVSTLYINKTQQLSPYAHLCLWSFVRKGYAVKLYTYNRDAAFPDFVTVEDARSIIPEEWVFENTHEKERGSFAMFSNLFRYTLLSKIETTWIDTDVILLADKLPSSRDLYGWEAEDRSYINGAILRLSRDSPLLDALVKECHGKPETLAWGQWGPRLLTRLARDFGLTGEAHPASDLYPLGWPDALAAFAPNARGRVDSATREAVTLHLWNEILRRYLPGYPRCAAPRGSFLAGLVEDWELSQLFGPALTEDDLHTAETALLASHANAATRRRLPLWSKEQRRPAPAIMPQLESSCPNVANHATPLGIRDASDPEIYHGSLQSQSIGFATLAVHFPYRQRAKQLIEDQPSLSWTVLTDAPVDFNSLGVRALLHHPTGPMAVDYLHKLVATGDMGETSLPSAEPFRAAAAYHDKRFALRAARQKHRTAVFLDADTRLRGALCLADCQFAPGLAVTPIIRRTIRQHLDLCGTWRLPHFLALARHLQLPPTALEEASWCHETLIALTEHSGEERFHAAWGIAARFLESREVFSGEGGVIGLAALASGMPIDFEVLVSIACCLTHEGGGPKRT